MSALTDLFTSMANKIRSKTGTATTYTPPQMVSDGIDDVFDAGVASATTPITPSNSSPVAMAANTGYKPTSSGYAISSYSSVTPSSSQVAVASGDVVKIGGSGVIVNSIPTPTNLTPSNSSPATITSGGLYSATAGGKAVETITDVTPSYSPTSVSADDIVHIGGTGKIVGSIDDLYPNNSNPVALIGQNTYKVDGTRYASEGYAIKSYSSITPSDTSPAAVASGEIIKLSSAGYLYKTQQTKGITLLGSITIADTSSHTVTLSQSIKNFRYIMVCMGGSVATDKIYGNEASGGCAAVVFFDTDKWVSGFSTKGAYTIGSGSSQSTKTDTVSYNSNTKMNIQHNQSNSRSDFIYGIN